MQINISLVIILGRLNCSGNYYSKINNFLNLFMYSRFFIFDSFFSFLEDEANLFVPEAEGKWDLQMGIDLDVNYLDEHMTFNGNMIHQPLPVFYSSSQFTPFSVGFLLSTCLMYIYQSYTEMKGTYPYCVTSIFKIF